MGTVAYRLLKAYCSKTPETTFNTPLATGASFDRVAGQELKVLLPQISEILREGLMGTAGYLQSACNDYITHPGFPLMDEARNFDGLMGKFLFRGLGGTPANTALTSPAQQWDCLPLAQTVAAGDQLPGTSFITELDFASFLFGGGCVEEFRISQPDLSKPPMWKVQLIGTGVYVNPHGVTSLPSAEPAANNNCPNVNGAQVIWTDSSGTTNWSTTGRVLGYEIGFKNNHKLNDRRQGNGQSGSGAGVAYRVSNLRRGLMTVDGYAMIAVESGSVDMWTKAVTKDPITDLTFTVRGALITGSTYESVSIIAPKAKINASDLDFENKDDLTVFKVPFRFLEDSGIDGLIKGQVVNQTTSVTGYK